MSVPRLVASDIAALLNVAGSIAASKTITGVVIQDGAAKVTANAHTYTTGVIVVHEGIGGAVEANGIWPVTVIDANNYSIPLAAITAYTTGGTSKKLTFTAGLVLALKPYQLEGLLDALNRISWDRADDNSLQATIGTLLSGVEF